MGCPCRSVKVHWSPVRVMVMLLVLTQVRSLGHAGQPNLF
jgi:hypothetical protein